MVEDYKNLQYKNYTSDNFQRNLLDTHFIMKEKSLKKKHFHIQNSEPTEHLLKVNEIIILKTFKLII
jgi:hypothetical protein